jgi:hypothetical protein
MKNSTTTILCLADILLMRALTDKFGDAALDGIVEVVSQLDGEKQDVAYQKLLGMYVRPEATKVGELFHIEHQTWATVTFFDEFTNEFHVSFEVPEKKNRYYRGLADYNLDQNGLVHDELTREERNELNAFIADGRLYKRESMPTGKVLKETAVVGFSYVRTDLKNWNDEGRYNDRKFSFLQLTPQSVLDKQATAMMH